MAPGWTRTTVTTRTAADSANAKPDAKLVAITIVDAAWPPARCSSVSEFLGWGSRLGYPNAPRILRGVLAAITCVALAQCVLSPCNAAESGWKRFALVSLDRRDKSLVVGFGDHPVQVNIGQKDKETVVLASSMRSAEPTVPAAAPGTPLANVPGAKVFWAFGRSILARHFVSTLHVDVWVEDANALQQLDSKRIASDVETAYRAVIPRFGNIGYGAASIADNQTTYCSANGSTDGSGPRVVGSNGARFTILILAPANDPDDYADLNSYIPQSAVNCHDLTVHSNEIPALSIVHFNMRPADGKDYYDVALLAFAHEMQHIANFVRHSVTSELSPANPFEQDDSFINEGLSQLAEDYTFALVNHGVRSVASANDQRAQAYLLHPESASLFGFNPSHAATPTEVDTGYGGAYLFQRYLLDRFGEPYLNVMAHSSGFGFNEIAKATGVSFSTLATDFAKAIAIGSCHANTLFCELRNSALRRSAGVLFQVAPSDGDVTIRDGSISYWKIRADALPRMTAPLGSKVLLVPLDEH